MPTGPGVYVFTKDTRDGIEPGPWILYVGKSRTLRSRISQYLADPGVVTIGSRKHPGRFNTSLKHAGKTQIMIEAMHGGGRHVWVRWAECRRPERVEGALIAYLDPGYNSREEPPLLAHDDSLP